MAKARKKGRPKSADPKGDVLRIRLTDAQRDALNKAAAGDGLETSTWVRQVALRAAGALPAKK